MTRKLFVIAAFSLCTLALAAPSQAQHRNGSGVRGGGGVVRGGGSVVVAPRAVTPAMNLASGLRMAEAAASAGLRARS